MKSVVSFILFLSVLNLIHASEKSPYDQTPWVTHSSTPPWERNIIGVEIIPVEKKGAESLASIMGHSFIRLVDDGAVEENWTMGFTGYYWDEEKQEMRPAKALSGLGLVEPYDLITEFKTLREISTHYAFKQHRFMERILVPMSSAQIEAFKKAMQKYAQLSIEKQLGAYRFIDKNCSSEIVQILFEAMEIQPHFLFVKKKQKFATPFMMEKVLGKFGLTLPRVGIVDAASIDSEQGFLASWRPFERLYQWCSPQGQAQQAGVDGKECVQAWISEARVRLGTGWLKDVARTYKKGHHQQTAGSLMIEEINSLYMELSQDHSY